MDTVGMETQVNICSIIKKEQRYFNHWKEYHKDRGFNKIILIIDDPDEQEDYEADEYYYPPENTGRIRQVRAYNEYMKANSGKENGWCIFVDIDEYLDFTADDFRAFIGENDSWSVIRLPQVVYVADGEEYLEKYIEKPVTERFTKISTCKKYQAGKLAVKYGAHIGFISVHEPCFGYTAPSQYSVTPVTPVDASQLQIKHFITKSKEEWDERRLGRGDITPGKFKDEDFYLFNEIVQDTVQLDDADEVDGEQITTDTE